MEKTLQSSETLKLYLQGLLNRQEAEAFELEMQQNPDCSDAMWREIQEKRLENTQNRKQALFQQMDVWSQHPDAPSLPKEDLPA